MTYQTLIYDVNDRIATITLNRPDAMNATTDEMYHELQALLGIVGDDASVACVILTGAGRGFCAGADLKTRKDDATPLERRARHRWILKDILEPLYRLEKPVIAAVNGAAAGAGFNIALACDFIIASDQASFMQAFARVGLVPDLGGLYLLGRVIGINKAKELCFTARKVSAEEARALGIVNHLEPYIQQENVESYELVVDTNKPIISTADMKSWDTSKPYDAHRKTHVNLCVYDNRWEKTTAFHLDRSEHVG